MDGAARKCMGMLRPRSLSLAFLILFLIPFLNLGLASGVISTIQVPGFIQDYIGQNRFLPVLCAAAVALLAVLLSYWLYSLHFPPLLLMGVEEDADAGIAKGHGQGHEHRRAQGDEHPYNGGHQAAQQGEALQHAVHRHDQQYPYQDARAADEGRGDHRHA